jgi:hypothetical protein
LGHLENIELVEANFTPRYKSSKKFKEKWMISPDKG